MVSSDGVADDVGSPFAFADGVAAVDAVGVPVALGEVDDVVRVGRGVAVLPERGEAVALGAAAVGFGAPVVGLGAAVVGLGAAVVGLGAAVLTGAGGAVRGFWPDPNRQPSTVPGFGS